MLPQGFPERMLHLLGETEFANFSPPMSARGAPGCV